MPPDDGQGQDQDRTSEPRLPVAFDPEQTRGHDTLVRRRFWAKLGRHLARLPFAHDLVAAYFTATDKATPVYVKAVLMWALAYFVMPLDLIPDFLAGAGFTDDASVLAAAISAVSAHITPGHRARARDVLEGAESGKEES